MCGIAGIYSPGGNVEIAAVRTMLAAMRHRGPDDRGEQVLADQSLALGHLRLSILDLSPLGHQPMATSDRRTWIVYNGEIYNFREIRAELVRLGMQFRSESDTEVVLAAYRTWGLKAVERFRGMFAFAIWDDVEKLLHLGRDRFGVKPLYYSVGRGQLAFASEMKGLSCARCTTRNPDPQSILEFVQYGYISAPRSVFSDVRTVYPGTICTVDARLRITEHRYWDPSALYDGPQSSRIRKELTALPDEALLDHVEETLHRGFAYRMVADVPVGVFLSGGIDSSLVAALLARRSGIRLKTFTIGFSGSEFDESSYARGVSEVLGTEHVEFPVSPDAALAAAAELADIADEPIGDSSLIPTLMVSRLARQHVKVALSGDGADELFGGYARYAYCGRFVERSPIVRGLYFLSGEFLDLLPRGLVARAYAIASAGGPRFAAISDKLRKFVSMTRASSEFEAYDAAISEWAGSESCRLVAGNPQATDTAFAQYQSVRGADPRDRFMHFDMTRYLPGDLLVKVDRASMAVSLEAREPFLDQETAALAAALPMRWKIRGPENKFILRELLKKHLPRALFARPKQGFSAPIADWLRGPLRPLLLEELSAARVAKFGVLDSGAVHGALTRFLNADRQAGSAAGLWILLQVQQWAGRWLGTQSASSERSPAQEAAIARSATN
jgi:asparagine synthase (glutamine-hydrolysing)